MIVIIRASTLPLSILMAILTKLAHLCQLYQLYQYYPDP